MSTIVTGKIIDLFGNHIYPGKITIINQRIERIEATNEPVEDGYLLPGFVDAHVHIESSMLVPTEFARLALLHGTVATVSDPHEIANVLGIEGVRFMVENAAKSPLKFNFGAPSCVPATGFETAGATITAEDIAYMFDTFKLKYLSEMMNFPGVLRRDPLVMDKINEATKRNLPIDGHAPGLKGEDARYYADAGISTDHECFTLEEALDKIQAGMYVIIREGSAAKNYNALHTLIKSHPDQLMFCSDDKHPDDLIIGHINLLVARSIALGYDLFDVLRIACMYPVEHYQLDVGILREGDPADFIRIEDLKSFKVIDVWINGHDIVRKGNCTLVSEKVELPNKFIAEPIAPEQLTVKIESNTLRVIHALDGELITKSLIHKMSQSNDEVAMDTTNDILKLVVYNRYENAPPAIAFIHGFGLKQGAIAGSVAHDCHNILAVGTSDQDIAGAINLIVKQKGGICVFSESSSDILPLPIAGIMTDMDGVATGHKYAQLDKMAKELGSTLKAPFMTLSFMALLVIPSLKLSDKGLFDGITFKFTSNFV